MVQEVQWWDTEHTLGLLIWVDFL
uniref:Uncharacterized protein n=1 Tax=Anguilla anguilla TaxID=7936 RepID=A0A0E9VB86_ANGAN